MKRLWVPVASVLSLLVAACETAPPPYPPDGPYQSYPPDSSYPPYPPGAQYPPDPSYPPQDPSYPPGAPYPPNAPYPSSPYPPGNYQPGAPGVLPLSGSQWRVHAINGRDTPVGDFFMRFDQDRVEMKFNCNGLGANYEVRDMVLDLGVLAGTKMACPDMSWERDGTSILERDVQLYWAGPKQLTLSNSRGSILLRR